MGRELLEHLNLDPCDKICNRVTNAGDRCPLDVHNRVYGKVS